MDLWEFKMLPTFEMQIYVSKAFEKGRMKTEMAENA